MTRETKIGLLVGLAFIIVIGVLLSDHMADATRPPQALMADKQTVMKGTAVPGGQGTAQAPLTITDVRPAGPILVQPPDGPKSDILVGPQPGGRIVIGEPPTEPVKPDESTESPVAVRTYKAEPGDTLSKMARKLLGGDTRANRELIMKSNPSLVKDPHKVVSGQSYQIPVAPPINTANREARGTPALPVTIDPATTGVVYTTREGDTLWKIAREQVGSTSAVESIMELNRDVLKAGDKIRPNMKLKLPPKAVALAR
jgi:nucleoid-associated protein YgaU